MAGRVTLNAMFGTYPHTEALKAGLTRSDGVALNIADVAAASTAFKRVVALEFDVAELSVVSFLIAKSRGAPLVLRPADRFSRAKPPALVYDASAGPKAPIDFQKCRIGVAYYIATTSVWMQVMLAGAGVDPASISWIAVEGPQDPAFRDPPNVERAPSGAGLLDLLRSGAVDAIVTTAPPAELHFKAIDFPGQRAATPVLDLPAAMQSHHMVVIKQEITQRQPDAVRELWRMMLEARELARQSGAEKLPAYGLAANRPHLETVIDVAHKLGIIPQRLTVDDLVDGVTAGLPASN
jgi:4,5-dihydroxyphthalate decarboxylase